MQPTASDRFKCRLPRSISGLTCLGRWVDRVSITLQLNPQAEYALRLCLEEAVANIVMHGGPSAGGPSEGGPIESATVEPPGETIRISLQAEARRLLVTIEDSGAPFDPVAEPLPDTPVDLPGGNGLRLLRRFAASTSYRRLNARNQLALTIDRT